MKNKKGIILFAAVVLLSGKLFAQESSPVQQDTVRLLEEIKVIGKANRKIETEIKKAATVDEALSTSDNISFIKRGAYAWEPLLNNMSTERSIITIDGMHIFGACTDKMDPVTSYVESNNLSTIDIKSGQEGSAQGSTIAGSIDLKQKSTAFSAEKMWQGAYQTGVEFNNNQFFNLANLSYSSERLAADGSISFRKAGNYFDGSNTEVKHSQFNKFNTSVGLAYKLSPLSSIKVDAIFDKAKDVGFPALPMDLWLSRAIITSATYNQQFEKGLITEWDWKVYFNSIEHYMDDTQRPENLVHMDMPGWSTTFGTVSKLNLRKDRYSGDIQVNAYQNLSIAEMTMYPQDRSKKTMFAYSWPWVTTRFIGFSTNNSLHISNRSQVDFGGSLGLNYNHSKYVEFNWIFYPGASQSTTRVLPNLYANYTLNINELDFSVGTGYGHRAPSVSEGYGYYIYNSFDRYDYIGNPDLDNEISYEANASAIFNGENLRVEAKFNYFYIQNYIVGRILSLGSPMNYQSVGVKGYTALNYAELYNFAINADYKVLPNLNWKGTLTYARAMDDKKGNLPFIRPLSYQTSLHYNYGKIGVQTSVEGDLAQVNYSPEYGENKTPSYMIWDASVDYKFQFKNIESEVQVGAENLLNKYYTTYADWGNIPRVGRNIFTSLKVSF